MFMTCVDHRFRPALFGSLITLMMVSHFSSTAHADPVGLMERYALAEDRQSILDELVPGSVEFYYYHCLHYQVTGQLAKSEDLLLQWENNIHLNSSPLLRGMLDRQRLLTFGATPDLTIKYLRARLGIQLNHTAPPLRGERRYPDALPGNVLVIDTLIDEALRLEKQLTQAGLQRLGERFLAKEAVGLPVSLQWLLEQVDGPWMDNLDSLVIMELKQSEPDSRRFGELAAHRWLTELQLERVAEAIPEVAFSEPMIRERLLRMRPSDDSDMGQQLTVRRQYYERADEYLTTLPPAWNALKAAVLYRLLEADLAVGKPLESRFVRYLQLPRESQLVPLELRRNAGSALVKMNEDYSAWAFVPPIGNDADLVRSYLEIFLADAESPAAYAPWLQKQYLDNVFVETQLLNGVGAPADWYRQLSPANQQSLKEKIELTLAPENLPVHDPTQPSQLLVDVKNIQEVVVRIYKINPAAYYRTHTEPLNSDLDLDGLVATHQRRIEFSQPAVRRHRETLALPEIEGPGVWVVDLLGGGLRTRAMIRRGEVQALTQLTVDGLEVKLFDEQRQPLQGGRMWIGSQEFAADESGVITLPMVANSTTRRGIVVVGDLAETITLPQLEESYALSAGVLIREQQLLAGRTATIGLRPRLTMNGEPVSLSLLQDAYVEIVSTDLDGIQSTKRYDDLQWTETTEMSLSFRVPARLQRLDLRVVGQVERIADGRIEDVQFADHWNVNGIDQTVATVDAYLTRRGEDWVIEVRGRNGELAGATSVAVTLQTTVRVRPVQVTLQTNDAGVVVLGKLPNVTSVSFGVGGGAVHQRHLILDQADWPVRVHAGNDRPVQFALETESPLTSHFRIWEMRQDRPLRELPKQLSIEDGLLSFSPLQAGNYRLDDLQRQRTVSIAISDGDVHNGYAVGTVRALQVPRRDPLGITSIETTADGIEVQLSGDAPAARVHVLASHYVPRRLVVDRLRLANLSDLQASYLQLLSNAYISGMKLGEEYEYVLKRQFASKYPGVMLPQPSLLLNPWETDQTTNQSQIAADGDQPQAAVMASPKRSRGRQSHAKQVGPQTDVTPTYDFLADGGGVALNLLPDENGKVTVPAALLEEWPIVQIVVMDPNTLIQRTLYGKLAEPDRRDLRLAQALQAESPYAFERGVLIASPDQPLKMEELGTAQLQVYSNLADLMGLYQTLVDDPRLDDFRELARWHQLDDEAKREAYGRLACHELHLFLSQHDRPFFKDVVRPFLENKKERQLIDEWLLGTDLTPWTEPWKYHRLNAIERAVLARAVPAARDAILRDLNERVAMLKKDPERLRRAVESGLRSRRLSESLMDQMDGMGGFGGGGGVGGMMMGGAAPAEGMAFGGMGGRGIAEGDSEAQDRAEDKSESAQFLEASPEVNALAFDFRKKRSLSRVANFYQPLDPTKQWAESQWDQVRTADADAQLIAIDHFWADWAKNGPSNELSQHLLDPTDSYHAALAALAVCGLPLQAGDVALPDKPGQAYAPEHSVAVITKRLVALQAMEGDPSLLVGQRFEAVGTPPVDDEDQQVRVAPVEYLTQVAYVGQVIVTNPTPQPRTVDLLWQIPAGAIPLAGSLATDSATVRLEPFAVHRQQYEFYFPAPGTFVHYPVCVSQAGRAVALGQTREFNVVASPTVTDEQSWQAIARDGSAAQIGKFLQTANLHRLDWSLVLHRMRELDVYETVLGALRSGNVWVRELFAYSLHHQDLLGMQEYLASREDLIETAGPVFKSSLVTIQPIPRNLYEHLEYAPLVRARIHPLRPEPEILNDKFLLQYREFMKVLAYQQEPSTDQQLALCYYLLIQNRIEEALARFEEVKDAATNMRLQRDYLTGYLALHQGDLATAEKIAQAGKGHPVPRWKERFGAIAEVLQQHRDLQAGLSGDVDAKEDASAVDPKAADLAMMDRERRQARAADSQPSLNVVTEGKRVRITHRNAPQATIKLYRVDLELLFSKTPFVKEDLARMATVQPDLLEPLKLTEAGTTEYLLEDDWSEQTLLIEVVSGSAHATTLYYGGRLTAYVSEGFGQLQVSDSANRQPVASAYVKVYGRMANGEVKFYKDGYTDLRGRFDYASLSSTELGEVQRFAILVLDPKRGASVHDVPPPTK